MSEGDKGFVCEKVSVTETDVKRVKENKRGRERKQNLKQKKISSPLHITARTGKYCLEIMQ